MGLIRLAVSNPTAVTDTTLFTADNQYLTSIIFVNKSTTNIGTASVWVQPSGSSTEAEYAYIIYDLPIDSTNSYETFRFAINQNDEIHIECSHGDFSVQMMGLVQYDINLGVGISSYLSSPPENPVDGMIWVDSDGISGTSAKPAYVYSLSTTSWIPLVGGINTASDYTFTGTVIIPGYEKEIPLQTSAPSSPSSSDLWIDNTDSIKPILKVYDGSSWVIAGSSIEADEDQIVIAQRMFMS